MAEPSLVGHEQNLHYSDFTKEGLISISYLPIHSRYQCKRAVLSADVNVLLERES